MTPSTCKICGTPHHGINHVWNKSNEPPPPPPTRKVAWNKPRAPVKAESFPCPDCTTLKAEIERLTSANSVLTGKLDLANNLLTDANNLLTERYVSSTVSTPPANNPANTLLTSANIPANKPDRKTYMRDLMRAKRKKIVGENGK